METLDNITLKLIAKIMQVGMTGYKIAELFNDANRMFDFYDDKFTSPGLRYQRKETFVYDWLVELKKAGWENVISYIARQLIDESRVYFNQDETHPYPSDEIGHLKKKILTEPAKAAEQKRQSEKGERIHGRTLKVLLDSIADANLRRSITHDIRDIEKCISAEAWKPAVVMCGSVLEAILLDSLRQEKESDVKGVFRKLYPNKKKAKSVLKLTLEEMIDISEELKIIHGYHAKISDAIRNFRNLIHPDVTLRQKIKPNKSIAMIGKEIIVAILEERLRIE